MNWETFWLAMGAVLAVLVPIGSGLIALAFSYGHFKGRADENTRNTKEALQRAFAENAEIRKEIHRSHQTAERGERIAEAVRGALQEQGKMPPSDTQVGRDGRGIPNPLLFGEEARPSAPLRAPPLSRPHSRPPPPPTSAVLKKP